MSNYVFVLDKNKKPLDPTHPAKARKLLKTGRAKVFRRYPFTIIIQDLEGEYVGRVAVRTSGSFNIKTKSGLVQGISYKYCKVVHQKDGFAYAN